MTRLLLLILCLPLLFITAKVVINDDTTTSESTATSSALFTRYDRNAYNKAAGYHSDNPNAAVEQMVKYGNLDKEKIKRAYFTRRAEKIEGDLQTENDPNDKCTTYLAPSSIPNSGLGMYTTIPYAKGDTFILPGIGIMLQDKNTHYPQGSNNLLHQYPWGPGVITGGHQEVTDGSVLVPGLGMLANSHLGLKNIRHSDVTWRLQVDTDGTDSRTVEGLQSSTLDDVGRGSYSYHSRVLFDADHDIRGGEELFVNYGDEWFTGREESLGIIPSTINYVEADIMIDEFVRDAKGGDIDSQAYEELLQKAEKEDKRLRAAFPDKVEDIRAAHEMGTARFSAKTSIQSIEWLEANGVCVDNIVSGTSTIPQAGQGAFATRKISKGTVITTTPLVTLEREQLQLWEEVDGGDVGVEHKNEDKVLEMVGHQLLLNYCYGHENSSLLLFPYSPTVNFINHGSRVTANAEIRWSTYPYHKGEWLNLSLQEVKKLMKTGLMFDIVATKDISLGEEVLLYYGENWENNWNTHIEDWFSGNDEEDAIQKNVTNTLGEQLNQRGKNSDGIIRTVEEQNNQPYPSHLETVCRFKPPKNDKCQDENSDICKVRWSINMNELYDYPCDVISRSSIDGDDWYFARVNATDSKTKKTTQYDVEFLPRYAIRLINRRYSKDQFARGVFREVIGLPDGLYPDHWMDLKGENGNFVYHEKYIYQD